MIPTINYIDDLTKGICLEEVFANPKQVYVLRKFFQPSEIDKMMELARILPEQSLAKTTRGFIAPCSFAQVQEKKIDFFIDSHIYFEKFISKYMDGALSRIFDFFQKSTRSKNLFPLTVGSNKVSSVKCSFFSFRKIKADSVGMHIHCHSQLHELNSEFKARTSIDIETENDVSYFILLQKPKSGGRLVVYDIPWQKGQRNIDNDYVTNSDGSVIKVAENTLINNVAVEMEEGDMILFESSRTWHMVEAVQGDIPRVTLGGFFSKSKRSDNIYYFV